MTPAAIDWLVLTGGAGSRLGQDKASTTIAGRTLLERVRDAITSVDPRGRIHEVGPEFAGGPAGAVAAALAQCQSEFVGVVAVDMPMVGTALAAVVQAIQPAAAGSQAWIPVTGEGRRQWLCAVYRREPLALIATSQDWTDRPFHRLVEGLACTEVRVVADVSLLDIDTPEDLARATLQIQESERTR